MSPHHIEEARLFLNDLAQNPPQLPYEPTLISTLFAATNEGSTTSIDDITALIEQSQKLATRVLYLANSALYALQSSVTSLRRAISILGFREVRTLVLMIGVTSLVQDIPLPKNFDGKKIWRHQVKTAIIAKALASAAAKGIGMAGGRPDTSLVMDPDEAYVAGLLHDIGKVFLASGRPLIWEAIEKASLDGKLSFHEAEEAYWNMDHSVIGSHVLHYWRLPLLLTEPINWHHAPHLATTFAPETRLLAAANAIAHEGVNTEGAIPATAIELMPEGSDPFIIGALVEKALTNTAFSTAAGLLN